jgi:hypothetical protein
LQPLQKELNYVKKKKEKAFSGATHGKTCWRATRVLDDCGIHGLKKNTGAA